jgi:hypothetical protein
MSPAKKAPPVEPLPSRWWNVDFRFLALTGDDGWLSHQKCVLWAVLGISIKLGIFSETLGAVAISASYGAPMLRKIFDRIFTR